MTRFQHSTRPFAFSSSFLLPPSHDKILQQNKHTGRKTEKTLYAQDCENLAHELIGRLIRFTE